ncbi:phosphatidylethanolamine N-methyltransferase [Homo sapiens]|uniref:Phosphatidylethanolamine N-methyltransferase n=1 Tax=Homo sapiens TaxID=9606 RepID=J3QLU8_HUMAN|nr:phosphatidylethanolamine N-methyltransferase [Homo sapiens]KAI4048153.1 phosphatidylethanolamine N-methyltransferase [Homo sapiens]
MKRSGNPGAEVTNSSVAGPDCCGGLGNIDFRQADFCVMTRLLGYVDPLDPSFVAAVITITFNPLYWNVVLVAGEPGLAVGTLRLQARLHDGNTRPAS